MRPQGIDVSNFQRNFDWQAWAGQLDFGLVKASEGTTFSDAYFAHNWAGMKSIGLYRFAYHFLHPEQGIQAQAKFFVDLVTAQGLNPGDNFVLDFENDFGIAPAAASKAANEFCHSVKKLAPGHRILVYTYPYFANMGNSASLGDWYPWIANYSVPSPTVPSPWDRWVFWQYTDQGKGNIDHDSFNGTHNQLKRFCHTTGQFTF